MNGTGRRFAGRAAEIAAVLCLLGVGGELRAQDSPYAGAGCVATIQNRSTFVNDDGTYVLPNIPANVGQYRVRVVCPQRDGTLAGATSDPYTLEGNGLLELPLLHLGPMVAQASSLNLLRLSGQLSSPGATVRLQVQAIAPDGSAGDVTLGTTGTTYTSSNTAVATVDANGVVTAVGSGNVVITARNDGLAATLVLGSFAQLDSDGDGIPDVFEKANGLNPFDPTDAALDPDKDGLTNLQEYQLGTNPQVADTDGDGVNDGDEVKAGTNPLLADTDGDGLQDGAEATLGTNPLLADTDGDGISDGVEVKLGLNPLVPDAVTAVTGHVTGTDGKPIAGVSVTLLTYFTGTTDGTGAFNLLAVPVSLGNLTATARAVVNGSFFSGSSQVTAAVSGGTTDVGTITLGQAAGQVSGTVSNAANQPVAGVQVVVANGNDTRTAVTDSFGLYGVSGLQAGKVEATAFDPATSLRADGMGILAAAPLVLNLKLGGFGTVGGTVRNAAGVPVGAGVTVTVNGALSRTATTDSLGHYSFAFVPLGGITLDATDTAGNHGRSTGLVTATAQTLNVDVQYLSRGSVSGSVLDGTGVPAAGATVRLSNFGAIGQGLSTVSDALGRYSFTGVFAGTLGLSAISADGQLGGSATVAISSEGQAVTSNITLQGVGTIAGTVYHADGTTVAPGAVVTVQGTALTATADSNGKYSVAGVPLGSYGIVATETGTSDRVRTGVTLTTAGATVTQDLKLTGLGAVTVTVTDASGATPVAGATVSVNVQNALNQQQQGVSAADGTATFSSVLAGTVTADARDNTLGLAGSTQGTLAAGGTVSIAVRLQAYGSVQGTVYQSDGKTPVAGASVLLDGSGAGVLSGADGSYRLPVVPSGGHSIYVVDAAGNILAQNNSVTLTTQGQVVTANFVIVGRGTVTGHILNPNGTYAAGIPVTVTSARPGAGNPLGTQSDANGVYTVPNVPLGTYTVLAQQRTSTTISAGIATGTMVANNSTVTTDVQLSTSLVPSTITLYDANNEGYTIRENGALIDGSYGVFTGDGSTHEGGSVLSLTSGGTETRFTGSTISTVDQNGRQVSIAQTTPIAGLSVTRRVYVPQDGYFSRYVELLQNPSAAPITVSVNLHTYFRNEVRTEQLANNQQQQIDPAHILQTSSGDTVLNIADAQNPDRWVSFGGPGDDDPFVFFKNGGYPAPYQGKSFTTYTTLPAVAEVFDGAGGSLQPSSAGYSQDSTGTYSDFAHSYATVTVPAGGTVGILHFLAQQNRYASANGSAARLAQLPPEALAGLTTADIAAIGNFAVPAGGVSTVAALPLLTNTISGFVYAADGSTVVPGAGVSLQGSDPLYARVYSTGTDGSGGYNFAGSIGGIAVLPEGYTVSATHPATGVVSPSVTGTFNAGSTVSSTKIVFTNTGTLQGTVSRGPTVVNAAGTVTLAGGSFAQPLTVQTNSGAYLLTGVPPGTYTLTAQVTNTLLTGVATATVTAGQTVTANINIENAGSVTGLVTRPDGSLAVNATVYLRVSNSGALSALVDTGGRYTFTDIPAGSYTLDVYDGQSNSAANGTVTISNNATSTLNLPLKSSGTVQGKVSATDGSSVAGLTVTLTSTTSFGTQTLTGTTGADGSYSIGNVQPGTILVRTTTGSGLQGTASGSLPLAGQTVTINLTLTAAGTVRGTAFRAGGTIAAAGVTATISPAPLTGSASVTTDSAGGFSFANVPVGGFTLTATDTGTGDFGTVNDRIQANGEVRTVNVTLLGFGSLTVTVRDGSGNLVSQASITVYDSSAGKQYTGTTNASGVATFTNLASGNVNITARDASSGLSSSANATIQPNTNTPVSLTLQAVGSIQGTIYLVDGVSPAAGATVQLNAPYGAQTTAAANGTYRFDNQSVGGTYSIQARDSSGTVRANTARQSLGSNGQVLTINATYVGVGTVTGTVTNTDGTRMTNATLQVTSSNSSVGFTTYINTGGDGTYTVAEMPIGRFAITLLYLPSNLQGYASGAIASDGDKQTADIQVTSSTITLPVTLNDGDGYPYAIQTDGRYGPTGTPATDASASPFLYAQQLSFAVTGGSSSSFGDSSSPLNSIQTLSGQGVEILQRNLQGVDVTRKIYVPSTGYFARRLDVLTNTTIAPITVTVTSSGRERQSRFTPKTIATSNGNTTVDNTVLWLVDDDDTGNLPFPRSETASGKVFAGTGAATGLSSLTQQNYSYYDSSSKLTYSSLFYNYSYQPVTIPAGGTVSFLTYTVQEATSATATTASQRLVQLPAEALDGLSTAELASIVNFKVPSAPLAALNPPATGGALSGHVYAGDSATPIPGALVYAQSTDLYYGSATMVTADATGAYSIPALPNVNYALEAVDPSSNIASATLTGTYPTNPTSPVTQDISFTSTGILLGTLKQTGTTPYVSASVYLSICVSSVCEYVTRPVAADGSFSFLTVLPGTAGVQATVKTPQGSFTVPSTNYFSVQVPAKQTTSVTLNLPATGNIAGIVATPNGTPASGVQVSLTPTTSNYFISTYTDANGMFGFQSAPVDTYTLTAYDSVTRSGVSKTATVTQDATTTVNLQLIGRGTVNAMVKYANGGTAQYAYVYVQTSTSASLSYGGYSDANGLVTINNVPTGAFTIKAYYPGYSFSTTVTGTMTGDGQTITVPVTLPGVGTISGTLTNADGSVAASASIYASDSVSEYSGYAQTDAAGNYSIYPVPVDRDITVQSTKSSSNGRTIKAIKTGQRVPGDGQTLTVNLRYPGTASSVVVKVQKQDGTAVTTGYVYLKATDGSQSTVNAPLDSTGQVQFTTVVEGAYLAYVQSGSLPGGSTAFTVTQAQNNTTVNVTITTTPVGTVQGEIFAGDGVTPLRNTNVSLLLKDNDTGLVAYPDWTDSAHFRFSNVQNGPGGYTLTGFSYDQTDTTRTVTATGSITTDGQADTKNLTLLVSSINGTVYLHDGKTPAPYLSVYGTETVSGSTVYRYSYADVNGVYQLNGLVSGAVTVRAQTGTDVEGTTTATLGSDTGVLQNVNVTLEASGTVTGTLYGSSGLPLPNQDYVISSSAHNGSFQVYGTTDSNGSYVQTGVPVGHITISSTIDNSTQTNSGDLSNDGDTLTLDLPQQGTATGGVFGTVFDTEGNPAANANVTLTPADTSVTPLHTTTNANGVYGAAGLPAGDVTVSAVLSDGTDAGSTTGTITDPNKAVEIDVGLQNTGQVSGTVVDSGGNPVAGVAILIGSSGDTSTSYQETTGDDGSFFFTGIVPGTITFEVSGNGYTGTKTAVLPYGGNLTVTVIASQPAARVTRPPAPALRPPDRHMKQPDVPVLHASASADTFFPRVAVSAGNAVYALP